MDITHNSIRLPASKTSQYKLKQNRILWLLLLLGAIGAAGLLSLVMALKGPSPIILTGLVALCMAAAIIYQPRWGIYLILFLSLVGDPLLEPSYPFIKNLSSRESLAYIGDAFIFSPMEIYLVLTIASWLIRGLLKRDLKFYKGNLLAPASVFMVFITTGLAYGLLKGSDITIALWEVRPIYHFFLLLILSSNLLTRKEHFVNLLMWIIAAVAIEGAIGTFYVFTTLGGHLTAAEAITDHPASIHMNTVFVLLIAAFMYRTLKFKRWIILATLPVIGIAYVADQRRAAFVSLAVALIIFAILLFFENRKLFMLLLPVAVFAGLVYTAAFWNSDSTLASPVRAVKSVLMPAAASEKDQSSNFYRMIENANTSITIHARPLTGVGFGNPFYVVYALPDISFFAWWEYFPHNSIIYIWVKAGVGAFVAMLFLIGSAILTGAQALMRARDPETKAVLATVTIYIVMHFLFAYVDQSWSTESMLYIGISMGIINCAEYVLGQPVPSMPVRFPWQRQPEPAQLLEPLPGAADSGA